jgi:hypothetical protein
MKRPALYHIRIQRRCDYNGQYPRDDFRAYREYLDWPKTFPSRTEAERFMERCFTFRGLSGRKISATVRRCGDNPIRKGGYG